MCLFNALGAPSHFLIESRHEAAVVSREHRVKQKKILNGRYISDHCNGTVPLFKFLDPTGGAIFIDN